MQIKQYSTCIKQNTFYFIILDLYHQCIHWYRKNMTVCIKITLKGKLSSR